jgi:hypothetical protein
MADILGINLLYILIIPIVLIVGIFFLSGLVYIGRYEVGIKTKKILGPKMAQGKIIACNGEIGIQADTLMPGLYWFNPFVWKVEKERVTVVKKGEVATVEAIDGESIPTGRLLADAVQCDNFQNARDFLTNKGQKGPQIPILRPGTYRINTRVFIIKIVLVTKVIQEMMGVVTAMDGRPLPAVYMIAPKPGTDDHNYFQDGQAFINSGGYRGVQLDTLQPGEFYINPMLFDVKMFPVTEVLPGYVAVIRSNVGVELAKQAVNQTVTGEEVIHEKEEVVLTTDRNQRGIWDKPVAPGTYNMNPLAFTGYKVPTSAVTIDWAAGPERRTEYQGPVPGGPVSGSTRRGAPKEDYVSGQKAAEFFKFSQLTLTSKDGFKLEADVRVIIRVHPQFAPFVIARFGSVPNLIEQIVHPLIDSSFRNNAGDKKAMQFIQSRTELQKDAFEKAKIEFEKYHVETQGLLISYIDVDKTLLDTQTLKEIALQQKEQYKEQANAQEERIAVEEKTARAQKQKDVIDAKLSIDIEADRAEAARKKAEGVRDSTKYEADGKAYENEQTGEGLAKAYRAQAEVVGADNLAKLKIMEQVAGGNVKIVPDFLIQGSGDQSGNLFQAWMATNVKDKVIKKGQVVAKEEAEKGPVEKKEEKDDTKK